VTGGFGVRRALVDLCRHPRGAAWSPKIYGAVLQKHGLTASMASVETITVAFGSTVVFTYGEDPQTEIRLVSLYSPGPTQKGSPARRTCTQTRNRKDTETITCTVRT
jgi:hypothetical protein